jgi:hypothetical protein
MGVWLPLALADIASLMFAVIRMWAAKPDAVKIPKRSELLKGWALPFMASALKAEEEEAEALALFNAVKNLKAKQEAKENADQVHK